MPKNFKKLLVCIVATFGITAMVFSCCKKVGLCASSSTSSNATFPLPCNADYGMAQNTEDWHSLFYPVANQAFKQTWGSGATLTIGAILFLEESNGAYYFRVYASRGVDALITPISVTTFGGLIYWDGWSCTCKYLNGVATVEYRDGQSGTTISQLTNNWLDSNGYIPAFTNLPNYPVYISESSEVYQNGILYFDSVGSPIFNGHTKGGVLSNYIDSDDLIVDSSDLPKVDTSAPTNSSSVPDWLQKILNGIGRINQSIQGGVLTIGDYIGSMTEKIGEWFQNTIDSIDGFFGRVEDKLDDIIDSIQDLFDGTTVSLARDVWVDEFENSIFQNFIDLRNTIESDILIPIRNANAPSTLTFTIPLIKVNVPLVSFWHHNGNLAPHFTDNYVYLFGESVTLDFTWYTSSISGGVFNGSSIRDFLVPIIATFLYVGMIISLLFKIPSFLNGASGFSQHIHSVYSHNGSNLKKG